MYHETIQGHSRRTVDEYFLDLRNFLRFLKLDKGRVARNTPLDQISIDDVDLDLVRTVTLSDVYSYMNYLSRDRAVHPNSPDVHYGLSAPARARKVAAIRSFYKYLTNKAKLITENPMQDLDSPHLKKSLPRYLNLEESEGLLDSVDGVNQARDYCILTLFLNCGLRISELIGLNVTDVRGNHLRVLGKGNKERMLYLNEACLSALSDWITERDMLTLVDQNALFVTLQNRRRISRAAVHKLVKKHLAAAGLDSTQYSSHKLRHTAATLMLQNGVDVRTLQEVLGHDHLNTTQIYTHVDNEDLRTAARANPLGRVKKRGRPPEGQDGTERTASPLPYPGENRQRRPVRQPDAVFDQKQYKMRTRCNESQFRSHSSYERRGSMKELLAELFDRYHQDVYTYLYSLCHDVSLAEDLTSEVFVEVVRSIAAFRGRSDIKTWMFSIARHQWYQHLRRKKRQIPTESLHDLYDSHFTGLQSPDLSGEVEQAVHELLSSESELTRRVFRMRLEGYSYYEIASEAGISESSARVVFFRVKTKLKQYLEKEGLRHDPDHL